MESGLIQGKEDGEEEIGEGGNTAETKETGGGRKSRLRKERRLTMVAENEKPGSRV